MSASIDMDAVTMTAAGQVAQPAAQQPSAIAQMATNFAILEQALAAQQQATTQAIAFNAKAVALLAMLKTQLDAAVAAGNTDPTILSLAAKMTTDAQAVIAGNQALAASANALNAEVTKDTPAT